jgi:hypothetical protein
VVVEEISAAVLAEAQTAAERAAAGNGVGF